MVYDEYNKQSVFNAGVAQAERIDSLQRAVNMARFNPQEINQDTRTFNYQVMISSLDSLAMEAWSKATAAEQKLLTSMNSVIHSMSNAFPILIENMNHRGQMELEWDVNNFNKLMKTLMIYEKIIKDVLDAHSLNSPTKDDDDDGL